MTIIQAIVLGVIQGLTEFIPVSSSAHLIVVPWLLGWNEPSLTFDIALHLGTLTALLWFFAADWKRLIRAGIDSITQRKIGDNPERRLAWFLLVASIPCGIVGFLSESRIEELFHKSGTPISSTAMIVMAAIIVFLGIALFVADRAAKHRKTLARISLKDVIIIGLSQAMSIFPGVSRSGSTITSGLSTGLRRADAARFSFLLAAPIVAGAGLMSLYKVLSGLISGAISRTELGLFAIGFLVASASGYWCIKFLLRFLQKNSLNIFVYYRWGLAMVIIVAVFLRG